MFRVRAVGLGRLSRRLCTAPTPRPTPPAPESKGILKPLAWSLGWFGFGVFASLFWDSDGDTFAAKKDHALNRIKSKFGSKPSSSPKANDASFLPSKGDALGSDADDLDTESSQIDPSLSSEFESSSALRDGGMETFLAWQAASERGWEARLALELENQRILFEQQKEKQEEAFSSVLEDVTDRVRQATLVEAEAITSRIVNQLDEGYNADLENVVRENNDLAKSRLDLLHDLCDRLNELSTQQQKMLEADHERRDAESLLLFANQVQRAAVHSENDTETVARLVPNVSEVASTRNGWELVGQVVGALDGVLTKAPTYEELVKEFQDAREDARMEAYTAENGGLLEKAVAFVVSRTTSPEKGNVVGEYPEALLARAELFLSKNAVEEAVKEVEKLPRRPLKRMEAWKERANERVFVDMCVDILNAEARRILLGV